MDKDKIINYVMSTPENTNPSVLKSLLDREGGGSAEPLVVGMTYEHSDVGEEILGERLSETWQTIHDAFMAGRTVLLQRPNGEGSSNTLTSLIRYTAFDPDNQAYSVSFVGLGGGGAATFYDATSPDGRPFYNYD